MDHFDDEIDTFIPSPEERNYRELIIRFLSGEYKGISCHSSLFSFEDKVKDIQKQLDNQGIGVTISLL